MGLLKLLTVLVIVFVHLAIISPAHEVLDISSKTSCSNEDGSVNIMYSCTASCGDRPCLFLLKNGETICKEEKQINDTVHTDVVTKCLTQSSMCVTNITTASSSLDCNQPGFITRTIESTISADDVNNSSMYAIRCWPPEGDETTEHFFYQDYILTKSPQCTSVSSDTSISTVTVTTTEIEYSLDLESSSPYIISSPSLSISTVTTSKVTSPSSSHSSRFTFSQSLSSSSSLSTTNQYTTTSKLTRSSSSLTRSSSSLSDNISLTSSTEPTFTTQGLTIVQGVGGAASVLILLVIGLSVTVVVMGVCLCRVKYKQIDRQNFNEYVAKNSHIVSGSEHEMSGMTGRKLIENQTEQAIENDN